MVLRDFSLFLKIHRTRLYPLEIRKREKKARTKHIVCTSQVKLIIFDNAQEIRLSTYKENPINDNKGKEEAVKYSVSMGMKPSR